VRKDIKNLHLGVYPPNGRVRVTALWRLNDECCEAGCGNPGFADSELGSNIRIPQSQREMISGRAIMFKDGATGST
jgi:hypothetical protein